uniref:ribosome silencing factor n=1 Tax=Ndongobacter massiliensis TaxID=1871025 RepID=UPI0009F80893|nr:ribosome silencing factor [Ndongobacter massiliensis]
MNEQRSNDRAVRGTAEEKSKRAIIEKAADDKLGGNIRAIDIDPSAGICDQFVVITARNKNHAQALADTIEQKLAEAGYAVRSTEGFREGEWILLDCDELIVHIFTAEQRAYYALEDLWK